jgi:hypothetical protein
VLFTPSADGYDLVTLLMSMSAIGAGDDANRGHAGLATGSVARHDGDGRWLSDGGAPRVTMTRLPAR